ncbi:MAG: antibiotic biosynthesis monooxygenase [Gammaproteobacteria bacterium]
MLARILLATLTLMPYLATGQPASSATALGSAFAVGYIETRAAAAEAGRSALEAYRDATRQQTGCVAVELYAQTGRPGHFAVLETWRNQAALDARDPSAKRQLMDALQPVRTSDYDERLYKTLTVAADKGVGGVRTQGVFVVSHVDVAPNTEAPNLLQKLADASRQEAGNLRFDVLQHKERANHFTVVEHWQSQAALDTHVGAAHTREYRDALQPLTGSPLDERAYIPIDPRVR